MSDIPEDFLKMRESQVMDLKDDPAFKMHEEALKETVRGKELAAEASLRIDEIESELRKKSGVYVAELLITNSGGSTISVLSPAKLRYSSNGDSAESALLLEPGNQPQSIGPRESKRLVLKSPRADADKSKSRALLQQHWNTSAECYVEVLDSNGAIHKLGPIKFSPR
jgi:hypothetical protein